MVPNDRTPDSDRGNDAATSEAPRAPPKGLAACLADIGVAVLVTDASGAIAHMNGAAERLTGYSPDEARGAPLERIFRTIAMPAPPGEVSALIDIGSVQREETAMLECKDGSNVPVRHAIGVGPDGGRIVVFRDVVEQQFLALQLARASRYDALTGLLNRRAISDRVEQALAECKKTGQRGALVYFDLDRFRLVNATCGHEAGDGMLQWVATRLHEVTGPSDAIGRIGGDEFAVLLTGVDEHEAERATREIQRSLLEFRFGWEEKSFTVAASFGLVFFGAELRRAADVLSAADHACRLAKDAGRGRIQIYLDDDEMARQRSSMVWIAGIKRHLAEGKLRLYAQDIRPLYPNAKYGAHFEILVRQVGDDGLVRSPVGIIQAAEHSGMMDAIDRFVVQRALKALGALSPRALDKLETCAINLSGVSLLREGLLDFIVEELGRATVPPQKICFEITETAALANLGEVLWLMQELGAMGCRFAIDDFGSGHASYGYIESLPVNYVKIDGMFVRNLGDNALHRAIVESVVRIGTTLGIKTIAEAVETQPIADLCASMGVHFAQGWLFAKPRPLSETCAELEGAASVPSTKG